MRRFMVAGLAVAALAAASPGGRAEERKGVIVFGDLQSLEPANTDHLLGVLDNRPAFPRQAPADPSLFNDLVKSGTRERVALDYGRETAVEGGVGYSWGDKGRVVASFWSYGVDESLQRTIPRGTSAAPQFSFNDSFNSGFYGAGAPAGADASIPPGGGFDFEGSGEIDASVVALDYSRDRSFGRDWTLTYTIGLRRIDYEESVTLALTGEDLNPNDQPLFTTEDERATEFRSLEVDGTGIGVGVAAARHLGRFVSIVADLGVSMVSGERDATRTSRLDRPPNPSDPNVRPPFEFSERSDHSGAIWDVAAGVRFEPAGRASPRITVTVSFSSWSDLVTRSIEFSTTQDPFPGGDLDDDRTQIAPVRDNVSFGGVAVGLRWVLGRR